MKAVLKVLTKKPKALWSRISSGIEDGSIATWQQDEDGDLTHAVKQWNRKAWLHAEIVEDGIIFAVIWADPKPQDLPTIASIYIGHFVGTLLRHCSDLFAGIVVFPLRSK